MGLSPLAPEAERIAAGRLFLREISRYERQHINFAFETTLSARGYLRLIHRLRNNGWRVELVYLALPHATMAKARVAERVAHGGHSIPDNEIARRFYRSLHNLFGYYLDAVDRTICLLNEGETPETVFIQMGTHRTIRRPDILCLLEELAHHAK